MSTVTYKLNMWKIAREKPNARRYIVPLFKYQPIDDNSKLGLSIMPLADHDLFDHIAHIMGRFKENEMLEIWCILYQLAHGIRFLHKSGIAHCDLRAHADRRFFR